MSLHFKNITYSNNRGDLIFNNFNLQVENLDKIGIYGKRGSGKTTLANFITDEINNYKGKIILNGDILENYENYFKKIKILFQNPEIQFVFPIIKDEYDFIINNKFYEKISDRIFKTASFFKFNIKSFMETENTIYSVSFSELKLIQIIFTLSKPCEYLILDEPFMLLGEEDSNNLIKYLNLIDDKAMLILSKKLQTLERVAEKIIKI